MNKSPSQLQTARQLRISPKLDEEIRRYQAKLQKQTPVLVTWSDTVRALIERGLQA